MADAFSSPSPPTGTSSAASPNTAGSEKKTRKEQPRIRRRNRLITSCLECRRRKLKCDKQSPCINCTKFHRDCLFIAPALDQADQAKIAEVKEKMGMLERTLEDDIARRSMPSKTSGAASATGLMATPVLPGQEEAHSEEEEEEEEEEDVKGLDMGGLATEDAAYYEDEGNDDIVDLGIQMGRLRITERIGGFVRPRFSEELTQALKEIPTVPNVQNPFAQQSPETWMAPGRDYVAPSSSFFFAPGVQKTSLMTYLPSRALTDKLISHYWKAVHILARTVHRPSFERQYEQFWRGVSAGVEPRNSFQAVVFAAMLSSVISMSEDKVLTEFNVAKDSLVESFKQGTEAALARANFLRTTKLETLQAFVMYLIPLCRAEVSRAHSALTGTCIRLAECMSLHRDPSHYTNNPIEIHIRRLIWYQICFLDLRTCEATGPRPQVRRDEYDTKFPLNIDDAELDRMGVEEEVNEDRNHFTDMTITRMRFECYEMHRLLWTERPKLEAKKITLTSILSKIQKFGEAMDKTYLPLLSQTHPLHVLASRIYGILRCRMYIMVLQRFVSNDRRLMPERLRTMVINAGVVCIECGMVLESTPELSMWSWYIGALHQYHSSLLLLSEMYAKERDPDIERRVWRCVDWVFGLPAELSGVEKLRMVFGELIGRLEGYQAMRRVRAPVKMEHAGPRVHSIEYQKREAERKAEREAREERERTTAMHDGTSTLDFNSSSALPQSHSDFPQQHQQQMPNVNNAPHFDFGLNQNHIDYSTIADNLTNNLTSNDPSADMQAASYNWPPTTTAPPMHSHGLGLTSMSSLPQSSDTSNTQGMPDGMAGMGGMGGGMASGSPPQMDIMPDIDWNEFDQIFGSADVSSSMMLTSFASPHFSATDLRWPSEGL